MTAKEEKNLDLISSLQQKKEKDKDKVKNNQYKLIYYLYRIKKKKMIGMICQMMKKKTKKNKPKRNR